MYWGVVPQKLTNCLDWFGFGHLEKIFYIQILLFEVTESQGKLTDKNLKFLEVGLS